MIPRIEMGNQMFAQAKKELTFGNASEEVQAEVEKPSQEP